MLALFARAEKLDVGLFSSLLRDLEEVFFIGLAGFVVGDLDSQDIGGPTVAVFIGVRQQGCRVGSLRAANHSTCEEKAGQHQQ